MSYYYTTADLLSSVKRRASVPDSQALITDAEILAFANEEMMLNLVPLIMRRHQSYFLIREAFDIDSTDNSYQIPYRAMGNKIKEVCFKNTDSDSLLALTQISIDELSSYYSGSNTGNNSHRFHIENESIIIGNSDSSIDYDELVFLYNLRPNQLVDSSRVTTITAINTTTGQITVDSIPDNFSSSSLIDFIKTNSPHRILLYDIALTAIDAVAGTFTVDTDDISSDLVVGDRICLQNETDLINAPSELHVMLAEQVAARVMESIGDMQGLQSANDKLVKMENAAEVLIDNRVTGSPIKANARRRLLRGRNYNRGG